MIPAGDRYRWHTATTTWFPGRLEDRDRFAAFAVDDPAAPGRDAVALAYGQISVGPPSPGRRDARRAEVGNVATEPDARGRGHARACLAPRLGWLDAAGLDQVSLSSTGQAIGLYRSRGNSGQAGDPDGPPVTPRPAAARQGSRRSAPGGGRIRRGPARVIGTGGYASRFSTRPGPAGKASGPHRHR